MRWHKGAAIILQQKYQYYNLLCQLKMRHYHTHISFALTCWTNRLCFSTKPFNLSLSHLLSSKRDHNQLHTQATKKCLIQFQFLMFQLIFPNCTLMISHLTLSSIKRIIQLLAWSDFLQDSFLHILIIISSQMNNHTNSVPNPNNSDIHVSPSLGNYTIA
jgi:hypothetical protein